MKAINSNNRLDLQIILGSSSVLERFGNVKSIIEKDGFKINAILHSTIEGENPTTMAKSTGLQLLN